MRSWERKVINVKKKNVNVIMMSEKQVKDMTNVSSRESPATQECHLLNRLKPMWQVTGYSTGQLGRRDSFKEWYP